MSRIKMWMHREKKIVENSRDEPPPGNTTSETEKVGCVKQPYLKKNGSDSGFWLDIFMISVLDKITLHCITYKYKIWNLFAMMVGQPN